MYTEENVLLTCLVISRHLIHLCGLAPIPQKLHGERQADTQENQQQRVSDQLHQEQLERQERQQRGPIRLKKSVLLQDPIVRNKLNKRPQFMKYSVS